MNKDLSFKQIFEKIIKENNPGFFSKSEIHGSFSKNIFNNFTSIIKELNGIEYEINEEKLIIENIENISINKEKKLLKLNDNFLKSLGEYTNVKKGKNKIIIEFDNYIIRYFTKPISKLIIINKDNKNEI